MRKPVSSEELESLQDWKTWVRWPKKSESTRATIHPQQAHLIPGLVLLIPSPTAQRFVVGNVSYNQPMGDANDVAKTDMVLSVLGFPPQRLTVPNAAVLCYVDYRMLSTKFLSTPVPDRFKMFTGYHSQAYYDLYTFVVNPG